MNETKDGKNTRSEGKPREEAKREKEKRADPSDPVDEDSLKLFPERRGQVKDPTLLQVAFFGARGEKKEKFECEKKLMYCVENSPLVKLMLSALKSSGCPVDYRRHFSCESCGPEVTGGYDPDYNQVVICYNRAKSKGIIQGVIAHELLHMWDNCRVHLDFNNLDHVACTEIRAANLMHCSYIGAMIQGSASPFSMKQRHQDCVKAKAVASICAVRSELNRREAWGIVDKVFDKCYNDLEPVGRRLRRNSPDMEFAYRERHRYGYY